MTRHLLRGLVAAWTLAAPGVAAADEPSPHVLAAFPIQRRLGIHDDLADLVNEHLLQELRRGGAFGRVLSAQEIAQLMPAAEQKTILECASDECALIDNELAGALGATHILVGTLARLEKRVLLNLKLFDLKQGMVVATNTTRVDGDSAEALLDAVKPTVVRLLMKAGLNRLPTAALFPLARKLGASAETADRFTAEFLSQLRRRSTFDLVLGPAEIGETFTADQQKVVTGCADDECSVIDSDMVGPLGVSHVFVGTVARADKSYVVSLKLVHVRSGVPVATVSERVGLHEEALVALATPTAIKLLVQAQMKSDATETSAESTPAGGGPSRRVPLLSVAGGSGAAAALLGILGILAAGATVVGAIVNVVPAAHRVLPIPADMNLQQRAVLLQAPLAMTVILMGVAVVGSLAAVLLGVGLAAGALL